MSTTPLLRSGRPGLRLAPALMLLAGLVAAPSSVPAPPATLSEAERAQRLAERDRYKERAHNVARTGMLDAAEAEAGKALAVERQVLGELHDDVVDSLEFLAKLREGYGNWAGARKALEEMLAIREHQPDRKDWRIADARRTLADLDRRAALTPDQRRRWHEVVRLNSVVGDLYAQGKYKSALEAGLEALRMGQEIPGRDHLDYATSLDNLAILYWAMGDYARAEPLLIEERDVYKKALGVDHPSYAASLNNLATLYQATGDYARAEPLLREAREIAKKALGVDHPRYATSLNNLAALYHAMGDYARAEPLLIEAREIAKKALGVDHPSYATSLNNLAELYHAMGDYARAEPLLIEARDVLKKALGVDHPSYAASLNNLAMLYQVMGDYARAEPLLREAREIAKKALGVDHPSYATSLNSLATLYQDMGDYARAEPLFREARDVYRKALGVDHPFYATSLNNLAMLYHAMGDYTRAEPLFREAREIAKKALGVDHPDYATSLNNLAELYKNMGDYARAEPLYREARDVWKKALGVDHPSYAASLNNLAALYKAMGDYARAEPLLIEALDKTSTLMRDTSSALGERQRFRLVANRRFFLDTLLSVAPKTRARPADLYSCVLDWKGAVVAGLAEERLARDRPELRPTLDQLAQVRARLAHLAFTTPTEIQRPVWRKQLDELNARKEGLEADLAARSTAFRQQRQSQHMGPDQVATALPAEAALIDLFQYSHSNPPEGGKGPSRFERRLLAFVLRPGRPVALVQLGPVVPIDEAVVAWRRAPRARQADALQAAAAVVGRSVWEPLKPHLVGVRTVLVAPDGALMAFPFAALPGSRPGSYLVEDLAIGYVASGRQAVEALANPQGPAGRGLLAVGDVDFQADPGRSSPSERPMILAPMVPQRGGFDALPATGPEASAARDLFHNAFADQPAALLTRAAPTEAELKRRLDGGHVRVVHLATHGFFESPARITAFRAAVRREGGLAHPLPAGKAGEDELTFALMPLLRSGVVLAGGGRDPGTAPSDPAADGPEREDGILTAEEVQALDLRGCELVVLSACETGLGELEYGQGVLGLQRAFQAAGARAVVASLWRVNDAATGALMEQFYTNLWTKKLPKLEALRQAQLAVLNNPRLVDQYAANLRGLGEKAGPLPGGGVPAPDRPATRSDPALWAAFVLGGDGR
jgi:CHAT domain-containing protein/tetratricopeptide (TPR) repeat protein